MIRPTGLVDPEVEVRPVKGQVDDLLEEIRVRAARNERVLVTTLTKRMAEDLAEYFAEVGVRCRYLHSEIETLERVRILRDLRRGEFDVLIGINLLREGLDLPEVSLVAILDADKEGYPAQRHVADPDDRPLRAAHRGPRHPLRRPHDRLDAPGHRRNQPPPRQAGSLQPREQHHAAIDRQVRGHAACRASSKPITSRCPPTIPPIGDISNEEQLQQAIAQLETQMREAAKKFEFERAAALRDRIRSLKQRDLGVIFSTELPAAIAAAHPPVDSSVAAGKAAASAASSKPRARRR